MVQLNPQPPHHLLLHVSFQMAIYIYTHTRLTAHMLSVLFVHSDSQPNLLLTYVRVIHSLKALGISTHTHTRTRLMALCPGLPGWVGTRKVKPIWILLKQERVSGSVISWVICKSAPRSRQITTPASHHSDFYRLDALPAAQPTASKHWRAWHQHWYEIVGCKIRIHIYKNRNLTNAAQQAALLLVCSGPQAQQPNNTAAGPWLSQTAGLI